MKDETQKIPLQDWARKNELRDEMKFKNGYWSQIIFVRDQIPQILGKTFEEFETIQKNIQVVSTHTSKSILLPVYQLRLEDGTIFTMRYNFHDWKISVESPQEVDVDFLGLFDPKIKIKSIYCEGFPESLVFNSYAENKKSFTLELKAGNYHIFTFFWIFSHCVLGNRNKEGCGM